MAETVFEKLHGAGNDFVFLDAWNAPVQVSSDQVQSVCDRHFGIGADGVIVVRRPEKPGNAGFMDYINADGTFAQMCGNGVRCFAKFVVDHGYATDDGRGIIVETRAGEKKILVETDGSGKVTAATVDMGKPILDPPSIPTKLPAQGLTESGEHFVQDEGIASPWGSFAFTCVSMGNPHAVCFIDDWADLDDALFASKDEKTLDTFDIDKVGSYYECHGAFPEKANIEFATIMDGHIAMRVYERGCGETLACGTGACATSVAAYITGRSGSENDVNLRGGVLHIAYDPAGGTVMMTGPAEKSFEGTVDL